MSLPASFQRLGLKSSQEMKSIRRLMIGTEGLTNTGKTEFLLSAPGPKIIMAIDTAFDSMLGNANPPASRDDADVAWDIVTVPMNLTAPQSEYNDNFKKCRNRLYELVKIPEAVTVAMDGDSDLWELQVLAEYGRTQQIHPWQYTPLYAVKRAMTKRLWDSGKIIIATNKLKDKYEDILDEDGKPVVDEKGKTQQKKIAGEYKRQGFPDQSYLWQLQIRHLYEPAQPIDLTSLPPVERLKAVREKRTKTAPKWGLRIIKCKSNPMLEGDELWGDKCNFKGLVEYVYPHVDSREWGLK